MERWERVVRRCVYGSLSARCGRCLHTAGRRDEISDLVQSTARWTALRGGWASYRLVICAFVAAAALPLAKERDKESFQYSLGDSHGGEPYVRCGSLLMALNGMPASCFCDWMNMDGHLCSEFPVNYIYVFALTRQ
jgi:hypothetical protein